MPDMESIAQEPSYEVRRQKLAAAVELLTGRKPGERQLDHQMLMTGLAAGHCSSGNSYAIGQVSTAEQNQANGRRKSRPLGAASGERREGVARPEFPACSVSDF